MNQAARDVLRAAALAGVPQVFGEGRHQRGRCAWGLIFEAALTEAERKQFRSRRAWGRLERLAQQRLPWTCQITECALCAGDRIVTMMSELDLLIHLNDTHELDFIGISKTMPVDEEPCSTSPSSSR